MADAWKHYEVPPKNKYAGRPFESRSHPDSRYRVRSPHRAQYTPAIPQPPRRRHYKRMKSSGGGGGDAREKVTPTSPTSIHNHPVTK